MKWLALITVAVAFASGLFLGQYQRNTSMNGIRNQFTLLNQDDLAEYQGLKDQKAKIDRANEILAKVLQLFLIDLGLRTTGKNACAISSNESPDRSTQEATTGNDRKKEQAKHNSLDSDSTPVKNTENSPAAKTSNSKSSKSDGPTAAIPEEEAKGAVHALYQAVLWRAPDEGGGKEATTRFSKEGWHTYINNAKAMIQSPEFLKDVEPEHSPKDIVNRMYSVFLGRCAQDVEMTDHLESLKGDGPPRIVSDIIGKAKEKNSEKVFEGGFSPSSCNQL